MSWSPFDYDPTDIPHIFVYAATITPEYYGSGFPPKKNHQVVAIAVCDMTLTSPEPVGKIFVQAIEDISLEAKLLMRAQQSLENRYNAKLAAVPKGEEPILTTFYGRTFTLPVLFYRSLHHGVPMFVPNRHLDVSDASSMFQGDVTPLRITDFATLMGLPERYSINIGTNFFEKNF